jgi:signal transduction histidine kinase/CheY-like chemotaxis protein
MLISLPRNLFFFALAGFGIGSIPASSRAALNDPGRPPLRNFSFRDMGSMGPAWSVTQDARGRILVGTNGLNIYDGTRWEFEPLKRGDSVRAIRVDGKGRIWIGAVNELGYFDKGSDGHLVFHSLIDRLPAGTLPIGIVRKLELRGDDVLVSTDSDLLIWHDDRFTIISLPGSRRLNIFRSQDRYFIGHQPTGLYEVIGESIRLVVPASILGSDKSVIAVEPMTEGGLFLTTTQGFFRFEHGLLAPVGTEASAYIRNGIATCALRLNSGNLVVGTYKLGLAIVGPDGSLLRTLNSSNGLGSSANIFSLYLDNQGALWFLNTGGVSQIDATSAITLFDSQNGLDRNCFAVAQNGDKLLVASAAGLFRFSETGSSREQPPVLLDSTEIVESFAHLDRHLLAGGYQGLLDVTGPMPRTLLKTGRDAFCLVPVRGSADSFYYFEVSTLKKGTLKADGTLIITELADLKGAPTALVEEDDGSVIVSTLSDGLFILPRPGAERQAFGRLAGLSGLVNPQAKSYIVRVDDQVLAECNNTVFLQGRDGLWRQLATFPVTSIQVIAPADAGGAWVIFSRVGLDGQSSNGLARFDLVGTSAPRWQEYDIPALDELSDVLAALETSEAGHRILWIAGLGGLGRIRVDALQARTAPARPLITAFSYSGNGSMGIDDGQSMAFGLSRSIRVQYANVDFRHSGTDLFETRLLGQSQDWSPPTRMAANVYSDLRDGSYTLQARTVAPTGDASDPASLPFTIEPPWFRRWWDYAIVGAAGVGMIAAITGWRSRTIAARNRELENTVAQRTAELTERTQQLEQASRAKDDFVSSVSHEIRNPLNAVIGLATALEYSAADSNIDGAQRKQLGMMKDCAVHLASLVEDILDFSQIEAGRILLESTPFSVGELMASTRSVVHELSADKLIPVDLVIEDSVPIALVGDQRRIRQILVNYLCNALRYAGRGRVRLRAAARPCEDGKCQVTFSVEDDGPGISELEQRSLFTKFSRGAAGRESGYGGTGLGLAVCRSLAEKMGGKASVQSELGRGSVFSLTLALTGAPDWHGSTGSDVLKFNLPCPAMVVDDQEFNQHALKALLAQLGIQAEVASSAEAALELLADRKFSVVFTDLALSGMTGLELAAELARRAPDNLKMGVVGVTAFATEEKRGLCLAAGMAGFVSKPVTLEKLTVALNALLAADSTAGAHSYPGESRAAKDYTLETLAFTVGGKDQAKLTLKINAYAMALERYSADLESAIAIADFIGLKSAAHSLASHLSVINHDSLFVLAQSIQEAAVNRDIEEARAKFVEIKYGISKLVRELTTAS